jgi:hypothetical protein
MTKKDAGLTGQPGAGDRTSPGGVGPFGGEVGEAFAYAAFRSDVSGLRDRSNSEGDHGGALPLANRTLECFDRASYEGGGGVDSVAYPAYWIARQQAVAHGGPRPAANGIQKGT